MTEKRKKENGRRHSAVPTWEWVVAGIGLLMLLALVGFTTYRIFTDRNAPPTFTTEVETIVPSGDSYLVTFHVTNVGDQTAAAVNVEGRLLEGEKEVERSVATLTYAPAHSTRTATLIFMKDPRLHGLEIRPVGFEKP
jgi:uncharacterized protein (TIGR02588 family)